MKISIVVPIYNSEKFLAECLDSIINQTFKDIEIILVNDGSRDNSLKICETYKLNDKRIKIINKENSGVMKTRKVAYENCTGDYIFNVDSDDYIALDCVEKVVNELIISKSDIVCFCGKSFDSEKKVMYGFDNLLKGKFEDNDVKSIVLKNSIGGIRNVKSICNSVWSKAIRSKIIASNIEWFDNDIAFGEDMLISFICFCDAKRVTFLEDELYFYRQFAEQTMRKYKTNLIEVEELLIERLLKIDFLKKTNCRNEILRHALETAKAAIFNEIKFNANKEKVVAVIKKIFQTNFYREMLNEFSVKNFSIQEKLLYYLLKNKKSKTLYVLGRIVKLRQK